MKYSKTFTGDNQQEEALAYIENQKTFFPVAGYDTTAEIYVMKYQTLVIIKRNETCD